MFIHDGFLAIGYLVEIVRMASYWFCYLFWIQQNIAFYEKEQIYKNEINNGLGPNFHSKVFKNLNQKFNSKTNITYYKCFIVN